MKFLRFLYRRIARRRVLSHGRARLRSYVRVLVALEYDIPTAEKLCPSLKHYRRRGRACVKVAARLAA